MNCNVFAFLYSWFWQQYVYKNRTLLMWGEEQSIPYCNRALVLICLFPLVVAVHLTGHTWPSRNYAPEESGARSPILRIVRYLLTAFCKLQELPVIFCCCASRNYVVGFVKSVRSISMQIRLFCSWFQTFAVFWMMYAFFWVIPRRMKLQYYSKKEVHFKIVL